MQEEEETELGRKGAAVQGRYGLAAFGEHTPHKVMRGDGHREENMGKLKMGEVPSGVQNKEDSGVWAKE